MVELGLVVALCVLSNDLEGVIHAESRFKSYTGTPLFLITDTSALSDNTAGKHQAGGQPYSLEMTRCVSISGACTLFFVPIFMVSFV